MGSMCRSFMQLLRIGRPRFVLTQAPPPPPPPPPAVVVSVVGTPGTFSKQVGQTQAVIFRTYDSPGGTGTELTGEAVTVASNNTPVATVSPASGVSPLAATVTCVAVGTATITATSNAINGTSVATVVAVPPPPPPPPPPSGYFYAAELPRVRVERPQNVIYAFTVTASNRTELQAQIDAYAVRAGHTKIVCTNGGVALGLTTCKKNTVGAYRCSIWSQAFDAGYFTDNKRYSVATDGGACFTLRANVPASYALNAVTGSHDYDFGGIIYDVDPALAGDIINLVYLAPGGYAQNVANVCQRFFWRHCFWKDRGLSIGKLQNMLRWDVTESGIFDSVFGANWQAGAEAKGIIAVTTEGKQRLYNTKMGGGAIGTMWGGGDPEITNLVPADIVLDRCWYTLPWQFNKWATAGNNPRGAWDGIGLRALKNRWESKSSIRVLTEDCIMEHSWLDGQIGHLAIIKSVNSNGNAPLSRSQDHTFRNVWLRRAANGINPLRSTNPNPSPSTQRVVWDNILMTEITNAGLYGTGSLGRSIESSGAGNEDIQFRHITALGNNYAMLFPTCSAQRIRTVIDENILLRGNSGIRSDGQPCSEGTNTLNSTNPGYTFEKNVIIGASAALYPATSFYPASTAATGFVDYAAGSVADSVSDIGGLALTPASPYKGIGVGGVDPGCDTAALMAKLSHVLDGDWTGT